MITLLDSILLSKDKSYLDELEGFKQTFNELEISNKKISNLLSAQRNIEELKEFAKFEIDKIESIEPKVGEYE